MENTQKGQARFWYSRDRGNDLIILGGTSIGFSQAERGRFAHSIFDTGKNILFSDLVQQKIVLQLIFKRSAYVRKKDTYIISSKPFYYFIKYTCSNGINLLDLF